MTKQNKFFVAIALLLVGSWPIIGEKVSTLPVISEVISLITGNVDTLDDALEAKFPDGKFRCLICYEQSDKLTTEQENAINSVELRKLIEDNGGTFRALYPDTVFPGKNPTDEKVWQDALAKPTCEMPWILVRKGRRGFQMTIPTDTAVETLSSKIQDVIARK